jgi:hypothetical protein
MIETSARIRLFELAGDREEELAEQEGAERRERPWQDQRLVAVLPPQLLHQDEHRDHDDLLRHEKRHEVDGEQRSPASETQPRERIRRENARDADEDRSEHRYDDPVQHEPSERHVGPGIEEVLPLERTAEEARRRGEHLAAGFERGRDHPDERHQEDEQHDRQQSLGDDVPHQLSALPSRHRAVPIATAGTLRLNERPRGQVSADEVTHSAPTSSVRRTASR